MFIVCTKGPAIWVCAGRGPMQLVEAANGADFGRKIVAIAIRLVALRTKNDVTCPHASERIMISLMLSALFIMTSFFSSSVIIVVG